ncbi:Ig-like domain-containing protein [Stenomitos frigidus]|uniref:Uncharacterized protein n=1 Tax=Stenomitos frigidus ULC18 TaxID=2107698 RepID=A0A2T1DSZ6_9CYAN|nr:Ig-like domain-containing protein [Stenomitos frigidus]PSB23629.1 hypothetical protein C7B82_30615 [Stenomitos frigidus ULC18]
MPDIAGNSLGAATALNLTSNVQTFPDIVTPTGNDYYRFTLSHRSSFNLSLTGLSADANVALLNSTGNVLSVNGVLQSSTNTGTLAESINATLDVGTYYIRVGTGASAASANYSLNVSAKSDLRSDILWRNYATGENVVWQVANGSVEAFASLQTITDRNWAIQGGDDFNQDGQTDILWRNYSTGQNAIWLMNGNTFSTSIYINSVGDTNWRINGAGDFNSDGKADIVWRNYSTGQNAIWLMNGTAFSSAIYINPIGDVSWQINGVGDFNSDGKADIVWRNYSSGQNAIWLMNGTAFSSAIYINPIGDVSWQISGVGDFNSDGKTDLLWRNYSSGQNAIWLMNGTTFSSGLYLQPVSDLNWRSRAPFVRTVEPTPISVAGNALSNAFNVGDSLTGSGTYRDTVSSLDSDYYRLNLSTPSAVSLTLTGLTDNLDVQLINSSNQLLQSSTLSNTNSETINSILNAGVYYVRVYTANGGSSAYALNLGINNLPVLVSNAGLTVDESAAATIGSTLLQVTDNDDPIAQLTYTVGSLPGHGALSLNGVAILAGATFTQTDVTSNKLRYQHDGGESLSDSFSFTVSDAAGGAIASNTFSITVNPVNDAPVLAAPGGQTVDQNANSLITGVSLNDPDAGTGSETITISAANGLVSLGLTAGLTFAQGNGSPATSITASGTLSAINNALTSLIYRSNASFQGNDTISLTVNDNGNTGKGGALTDSKTIAVTVNPVNKAPAITVPASQSVNEDTSLSLSGISISDLDAGGGNVTVSLSAVNGVLSLGATAGLTFVTGTGSKDRNLTITGTLALINTALSSLSYQSNKDFNGSDLVSISVNDNGNTGNGVPLSDTKSLLVTVTPVNDAPVLTVPVAQAVNENTLLQVTGISIADVDAGSGAIAVSLSATSGKLSLGTTTGLSFTSGSGSPSASLIFSGTLAAINSALSTLMYEGNTNFTGADFISINVNDNGNTGFGIPLSDSKTIAINVLGVNQAPVIKVPLAPSTVANTNLAIAGVSISDPDAAGGTETVTIVAANGVLSLPSNTGLTFTQGTGNQNSRITFRGTLAAINTAIGNLIYRSYPGFTGFDTISISVNDEGNTGIGTALSDTKTLFVNVGGALNSPPTANPDSYTTTRNTALTAAGQGVLANDTDPENNALTANLLTTPTNGTVVFNSSGTFTYTPNTNYVGSDRFTYQASDGIGNSNPATVSISVTAPVNQAPLAVADAFTLNQNSTFSSGNVLTNDSDPDNNVPLTAQLVANPTQGTLTLNSNGSFTYIPTTNFTGTDRFTYVAKDALGLASTTATVSLTVNAVNQAPLAVADAFTLNQNSTFSSGNVLTNDSDPDNNVPLTAQLVANPTQGTLTLNSNGSFTYIPTTNFTGTDRFTYVAKDALGLASTTATVSLTVNAVNQAPLAVADSFTLNQNSTFSSGNVLTNDSDPDNNVPLTAQLVANPTQGTLTLNSNGSFTYIPTTNFTGTDNFTYVAKDALGLASTTATVSLTVNAVNQAPLAVADSFTLNQNSTFSSGNVLTNDTDPDNNVPLTAQLVANPTQGTLTLNSNGSFTYIPTTNFTGTDNFTYVAKDALGLASTTATVSLTVNAVNQSPVAVGDAFRAVTSTPLTVSASNGVLKNDTDADSPTLTALVVSAPSNGSLALNSNGSFVYTPTTNFSGTDTFVYKANDGNTNSNLATVTLTVFSNTAPTANTDTYAVAAGAPLTVNQLSGILQNDSDVDGDTLTASLVTSSSGSLTFNNDGTFTYIPNAGVISGTDTFVYQVSDGFVNSAPATVTLSIGTNAAPIVQNDTYTASAGSTLTVDQFSGVLNNDTDAQPLTASLVSGTANGSLTLNTNGSFTYIPNVSFTSGTDTFVYQASDGALTASATVTLTVTSATAPIAQNDSYQVVAGTTLTVGQTASILNNDSNINGATLTAQLVSSASKGTLTFNNDGTFVYTPNVGVTGTTDTFVYQVNDGVLNSSPATVTLTITANARPLVTNDSYGVVTNTPLTVNAQGILANDTDSDIGQTLKALLVSQPSHGSLLLRVDGSFVYTPDPGYLGVDTFTYRANDGLQDSASLGTVSLTIAANAAPIANADTYSVNKNNTLIINATNGVLKNDTDIDPLTASVVTSPTKGSLTLNSDGAFTYTPNAGVTNTTDTFVYRASDGSLNSNATVTVTIKDTSSPPTAVNDAGYTVNANGTLTIAATSVLANDTDPEGDVLKAVSGTAPSHGTVTLNSSGAFVYTPTAGYIGADSFTYFANDGIANSLNPATVSITVGGANQSPVLTLPGSQVVFRNTDLVIQSGLSISDPDAGTSPVAVTLAASSGNLTLSTTSNLTVSGNGSQTVTLSGSVTNVNAALINLLYRPVSSGFTGFDQIAIAVNDNGNTGSGGAQTTNGTININVSNGPVLVQDINPTQNATATGTVSSTPTNLTAAGSKLFFSANDGVTGLELWSSDGTSTGTTLIADLNSTPDTSGSSNPSNLTVIGNTLYFTANNGIRGTELWKADLTGATAPTIVKDIRSGANSSLPRNLVNFNGTLYFEADDGSGLVLWKTDGTLGGTVKVESTTSYSQPGLLAVAGNTLYFTAGNGSQLWRINAAGTQTTLLQDISSGAGISNLVAIGNTIFFTATDSSNGVELWRSDGTAVGTTRISNINPGVGDANPSGLVNLNDTLYFFAKNGSNVSGLWQSTAAGIVSLVTALPSAGQLPTSLTMVGSKLFFVVDAGTSSIPDLQLWQSDGTSGSLVTAINATGNDAVASLTNVNGSLFFTANDGSTRIWKSDGTVAGTVPISASFTGITPRNLTAVGNRLFFTAEATTTGEELFVL